MFGQSVDPDPLMRVKLKEELCLVTGDVEQVWRVIGQAFHEFSQFVQGAHAKKKNTHSHLQ